MRKTLWLVLMLGLVSCADEKKPMTADAIIEKAIEKAGGKKYDRAEMSFLFRGREYTSARDNGKFRLTRRTVDSSGVILDVLTNDGFRRYREGREVSLTDSTASAFAESVNSVHYFVQLPYGLNGPAVRKELLGTDQIQGEEYYEIQVTFRQKGGGKEHEDIYMYWIHTEDFTADYLAYRFFVNGGGIRFRAAVNPRTIGGIRFVDYHNYRPESLETSLRDLDDLYEKGQLIEVSHIENEILEVQVKDLN